MARKRIVRAQVKTIHASTGLSGSDVLHELARAKFHTDSGDPRD